MAQEEVKFPEGSRIIPINPAAKYAVLVPKDTDRETINELADFLADWWDSGNPFIVMTNEIVLVKVGEVDIIEKYVDAEQEIVDLHSIAAREQLEEEKNAKKEEN